MFVYVEDGMAEEDRYPATLSKTRVECPEITHVDETTLPDAPASISRRASETTSASAIMDLPSKHMVDDLVDSETTDGGNSEEPNDNLVRGFLPGSEYPGTTESPMGAVGNETCYGLISSVTAREHFGDQQIPATVVPRPFPSIVNSPFSLQPGEQTPGSLPGTAQGMTPSHSPENLQTNFPLQQQDDLYIVNSSVSTVPDPTNPNSRLNKVHYNQPQVHAKYPSQTNYTTGRKTSKAFGNDTFGTLGDITFASSNLSMGSTWGDNRQTGRGAINVPTPPNGQGSG